MATTSLASNLGMTRLAGSTNDEKDKSDINNITIKELNQLSNETSKKCAAS
jgi:hypothetical protein